MSRTLLHVAAVVIAQHVSPRGPGSLSKLLAARTTMPVRPAGDGDQERIDEVVQRVDRVVVRVEPAAGLRLAGRDDPLRVERGEVSLHGWYYVIEEGRVLFLDIGGSSNPITHAASGVRRRSARGALPGARPARHVPG